MNYLWTVFNKREACHADRVRKAEGFKLVSENCSNCGKSANGIKRAWEEGSAIDAEKRRKKLEELKKLGFSGIVRG